MTIVYSGPFVVFKLGFTVVMDLQCTLSLQSFFSQVICVWQCSNINIKARQRQRPGCQLPLHHMQPLSTIIAHHHQPKTTNGCHHNTGRTTGVWDDVSRATSGIFIIIYTYTLLIFHLGQLPRHPQPPLAPPSRSIITDNDDHKRGSRRDSSQAPGILFCFNMPQRPSHVSHTTTCQHMPKTYVRLVFFCLFFFFFNYFYLFYPPMILFKTS